MKRSTNLARVNPSTLAQIRSGSTSKKQLGSSVSKKTTFSGKSGKFHITETSQKFEESSVAKKKNNYVMFTSKLGTEKQKEKLHQVRAAQPKPRKTETIIQTRKKKEYIDNYQYQESKDIRNTNPNRESIVRHRRLGEPVGGTYEQKTFTKRTTTSSGMGPSLYSSQTTRTTTTSGAAPSLYSSKTTRTTTRTSGSTKPASATKTYSSTRTYSSKKTSGSTKPAGAKTLGSTRTYSTKTSGVPKTTKSTTTKTTKTVVRSSSSNASRGVPSKGQSYSTQIKKYSTNTNLKRALIPAPATSSTTRTVTTKTTSSKVSSRTQSAGRGRRS
jgi:hypothetical protein